MNQELKTRWVEALRSGNYKQGQGVLKEDSQGELKYCCLGVLCDLVDPNGWHETPLKGYFFTLPSGSRSVAQLPYDMSIALGLWDHETMLMRLNDRGSTFEEIASYIEANL